MSGWHVRHCISLVAVIACFTVAAKVHAKEQGSGIFVPAACVAGGQTTGPTAAFSILQGFCHCCGRKDCLCHPGPCGTPNCDKNALKQAQAEYDKWLAIYKSMTEMDSELWDEQNKAYNEGLAVFDEQFWWGEGANEVSQEVIFHRIEHQFEVGAGERAAQLVGTALTTYSIANLITNMVDAEAKMLVRLNEGGTYAGQLAKNYQTENDALSKLNAARDRLDALKRACEGNGAGATPNSASRSSSSPSSNSPQQWQSIADAYNDAANQLSNSQAELANALAIAQTSDIALIQKRPRFKAVPYLQLTALVSPTNRKKLSPSQLAEFTPHLLAAYQAIARVGQDLAKVASLRAGLKKH